MDYTIETPFEKRVFESTDPFMKEAARLLVQTSAQIGFKVSIRSRDTEGAWGWFWRILHGILFVLTAGRLHFLTHPYIMVFAGIVWLPGKGTSFSMYSGEQVYVILAHETTHLLDKYLGRPDALLEGDTSKASRFQWIRRCFFDILYLVWPLPFVFALFRRKVEYAGYRRNLFHEIHRSIQRHRVFVWFVEQEALSETPSIPVDGIYKRYREYLARVMSSATYGWMYSYKEAEAALDLMEQEWLEGEKRGRWKKTWTLYS